VRQGARQARFAGRAPLGALLASGIVLAVDRVGLGDLGPWEALRAGLSGEPLETGIVEDRLEMRPALLPPDELAGDLPGAGIVRLTHPGITPLVLRTSAEGLVASDPALVVLLVSEFDTHHPLILVPAASFGSFPAVLDLLAATGPAWGFAHRVEIERLALASLLRAYRWRTVLRAGGLDRCVGFPCLDPRYVRRIDLTWFGGRPQFRPEWQGVVMRLDPAERAALFEELERRGDPGEEGGGADRFGRPDWTREPDPWITDEAFEERISALDARFGRVLPYTVYAHLRDLALRDYAGVQKRLVERTVEVLRGAGIEVLLVDGPVHPEGEAFFDPAVRRDFLAFVERLRREHGVRFLSLADDAPFGAHEFRDLSHLNVTGARRLTRAVLEEVGRILRGRGAGG